MWFFPPIDPVAPATTSVTMVQDVIRDSIGFEGLLMSDDISMGALVGLARGALGCGARRRLRPHSPLQREDRRDARGRGCGPGLGRRGGRAGRGRARGAAAAQARRSISPRCAAPSRPCWPADEPPAPGWCCHDPARRGPVRDASCADARRDDEPALVVDVEGFEGPLDLLLMLARQQKVDLAKISILALADQYLTFIEEARKLRLELAADYLVMAAWLAYLKSRLLLPDSHAPEGQTAEDMANALALRLKRLEAIREVAERLFGRPLLDRDVFSRGQPEPIAHIKRPEWTATLYDLLVRLCVPAPEAGARAPALRQAHGLVAGRGARRARAPDRPIGGLVAAGRVPHRLCGRSRAGSDRVRLELRLRARIGAGRACRDSSAGSVCADLHAQARRRRGCRRRGRRGPHANREQTGRGGRIRCRVWPSE